MRRTIAIVAVLALGSLGACTGLDSPPPGPPPVDPAVQPCMSHPEAAPPGTSLAGTACVEVISKQAKLLRRFVDIHVDATDQYGGKGANTTAGRYPFDKTVDSSWSHDVFLGLGVNKEPLIVTLRWTAIYQGAPGDQLVCYLLSSLGHEGVPMHKTVVSSTKPITVSCVVTVRTGGADA